MEDLLQDGADQPGSRDMEQSVQRSTWLVRVSVFNPYLVIVLCLFIVVIGYSEHERIARLVRERAVQRDWRTRSSISGMQRRRLNKRLRRL
jgi:hypothetical protein